MKPLNDMTDAELVEHIAGLRARRAELEQPVDERGRTPHQVKRMVAEAGKELHLLRMRLQSAESVAEQRGLAP